MSCLDDPQVLYAAEHTSLARQRTAFAPVGFGVVVERFGLLLLRVGNKPPSVSQRGLPLRLGACLQLLGVGVSVISAPKFRSVVRSLCEKEITRSERTHLGA